MTCVRSFKFGSLLVRLKFGENLLSLEEIEEWDLGALESLSDQMQTRSKTYQGLTESLMDASEIPSWLGQGAQQSRAIADRAITDISDLSATVGAIVEMVAIATGSIEILKGQIVDARNDAAEHELVITGEGEVIDGPVASLIDGSSALISPIAAAAARAVREEARERVQLLVEQIRRTGTDLEQDIADVLRRAAAGNIDGAGRLPSEAFELGKQAADVEMEAPQAPTDSNGLLAWKSTLSQDALKDVRENHPDLDTRIRRVENQVTAFEQIYGGLPKTRNDWIMADALDSTSYLEKNGDARANIVLGEIDTVPGQGVVRMNMYIPAEKVKNANDDYTSITENGIMPFNLGDNRGPSAEARAEESRVSIYIDYENGLIVGRQNPSAEAVEYYGPDAGQPKVNALQAEDGAVRIKYLASDPFQPAPADLAGIGVEGDVSIQPRQNEPVELSGKTTVYPSVEAYQYQAEDPPQTVYNNEVTTSPYGPIRGLLWGDEWFSLPGDDPRIGQEEKSPFEMGSPRAPVIDPYKDTNDGVELTSREAVSVPKANRADG